jgi:hypothetical protein
MSSALESSVWVLASGRDSLFSQDGAAITSLFRSFHREPVGDSGNALARGSAVARTEERQQVFHWQKGDQTQLDAGSTHPIALHGLENASFGNDPVPSAAGSLTWGDVGHQLKGA